MKKLNHFIPSLLALVLFTQGTMAQTLYRVQYRLPVPDTLQYDALLVLNGIGGGFARINITSPNNQKPTTIALQLTASSNLGDTAILPNAPTAYTSSHAKVAKGDTTFVLAPVSFWFYTDSNFSLQPQGASPASMGIAPLPFLAAQLLDPATLSRNEILPFFNRRDTVYQRLFAGPPRGEPALTAGVTMHMIIVANVNDATIGPSTEKDMKDMQTLMTGLAGDMKIRTNTITIAGDNYTKKNLLNAVNALKPMANDIVVFYYSGHGFRKSNTPTDQLPKDSIFPLMDMRANEQQDYLAESVSIQNIFQLIVRKGARCNLVIGDCCNASVEATNAVGDPPGQPRGPMMQRDMRNLQALFLQPNNILTTAANVAELATSNNNFGGFYTYFFKAALNFYVSPMRLDPPNWQELLKDARTQTFKKARATYCDKPKICKQNPISNIQ